MKQRILIVDDEPSICSLLKLVLEEAGYETVIAGSVTQSQELIRDLGFDLVISDLVLPDGDGIEVLRIAKVQDPEIPVIIITGFATVESAVAALKAGAFDYVMKPFENEHLKGLVRNALKLRSLSQENIRLRKEIKKEFGLSAIVGKSPEMVKVRELVQLAAESDAPVLIWGETGTGKELVAKTIHFLSGRAKGPFVAVNCGAIPDSLVESELFGHKKGAFTGATGDRQGRFVQANSGSLFLDEVTEMKRELQVKLLRAIETQEIQPVGSSETLRVDIRILSATNQNHQELIKRGDFREDLYYRLAVFTIKLPPLREHPEDLPELVDNYLKKRGYPPGMTSPETLALLEGYEFPGNVRELENLIESGLLLSKGKTIKPEHIIDRLMPRMKNPLPTPEIPDGGTTLAQIERSYITAALKKTNGNRTKAAKLLGISRATLLYRMKKYGLTNKG